MLADIVCLTFVSCKPVSPDNYTIPDGATVLNAEISDVYGNSDAIVTIISDDGFFESSYIFNALLIKHNLKGTVAGAVRIVDPYSNEWIDMLNYDHIELVNHSYNHYRMEENSKYSNNYFLLRHD